MRHSTRELRRSQPTGPRTSLSNRGSKGLAVRPNPTLRVRDEAVHTGGPDRAGRWHESLRVRGRGLDLQFGPVWTLSSGRRWRRRVGGVRRLSAWKFRLVCISSHAGQWRSFERRSGHDRCLQREYSLLGGRLQEAPIGALVAVEVGASKLGVAAIALIQSNRYLRIGIGRHNGRRVFRAAGKLVQKIKKDGHFDFWDMGPLP